jgi:hypothetical protein
MLKDTTIIVDGKRLEMDFDQLYSTFKYAGISFHSCLTPYDVPYDLVGTLEERTNQLLAAIEEKLEELLTNELHGSGWNGDWCVDRTPDGFVAYIDYQCMNGDGYYDGWIQFVITTDKDLNILEITNDADEETNEKYLWDCYHTDTLHEAFDAVLMQICKDSCIKKYRVPDVS